MIKTSNCHVDKCPNFQVSHYSKICTIIRLWKQLFYPWSSNSLANLVSFLESLWVSRGIFMCLLAMWSLRCSFLLNQESHSGHWNGRTLRWTPATCRIRIGRVPKFWPQCSQVPSFWCPWAVLMWFLTAKWDGKPCMPHSLQNPVKFFI